MPLINDLIFDIGFYDGTDTRNYLDKGYRVIAIEANPDLYNIGIERFTKEIADRRLILLNRVFDDFGSIEIPFFIHPDNKDWSTADKIKASYWGIQYEIKMICSIHYWDLIAELNYFSPYYIKCDIEGYDYLLIEQIFKVGTKPKYLSFELSRIDYYKIFSYLYVSGYKEFQLRNQLHNPEYSSGDFAEFLPANEWMNFDETLTRYMKYKELKAIDNKNLALGWVDIHARQ